MNPNEISIDELQIPDPSPNPLLPSLSSSMKDHPLFEPLHGCCTKFISKSQSVRQASSFQIPCEKFPNREMLACHFRNISYTESNVRTPQTLQLCIDHICKQYLPLYFEIIKQGNQKNRKHLQHFLYDRLKAIKCQAYVQGVPFECQKEEEEGQQKEKEEQQNEQHKIKTKKEIKRVLNPKAERKLMRVMILIGVMMGEKIGGFVGDWVMEENGNQVDQESRNCYLQALEYSLFTTPYSQLPSLLSTHPLLLTHLANSVQTRLKILSNNYYKYFFTLVNPHTNIFLRLVLWSQIKNIRSIVLSLYKKARINQKAEKLCKIMGYKKMSGWIDMGKQEDRKKLEQQGKQGKSGFDMEIKMWISEASIFQAIQQLIAE